MMQQVAPRTWTDTTYRGCNPSMVVTNDGVVIVDTPQLPTKAVALRTNAEKHGPIKYVINTEHHVDHIFGNFYFQGAGLIVHHRGVHENFMEVNEIDSYQYAVDAVPKDDPDGVDLVPSREQFHASPIDGHIIFSGDLTLNLGDHTFELLHTPGHTPGQTAVYVPEERVVFTGDTVFSGCPTFLMHSSVTDWLSALDRIALLDVDCIVPGHGPVVPRDYLFEQRSNMLEWVGAVSTGIARGWTREEAIARIRLAEKMPHDVGMSHMTEYIQSANVASLWDKLTEGRPI